MCVLAGVNRVYGYPRSDWTFGQRSKVCRLHTHVPQITVYSGLADETPEGCRHVRDNVKYTCKLCVLEFDDINQWLHHVRTIHDRRQYVCRGHYVCPECQQVYVSKGGMWKHVHKMHKKLTTYRCETCGKNFFVSSVYHDHVAAHTGVKRYTCSICEMRFTNKCTLKRHVVRVHPDEATHIL